MAKKVFIDPGHGGADSGAYDGKHGKDVITTSEDTLNLQVGLLLAEALKRSGVEVKLSRTKDVLPSLQQRYTMANNWKANAVVSIHFNAGGASARGIEVIHHKRSVAGRRLANKIYGKLTTLTPWPDRGTYGDRRGLAMINGPKAPAALVEYGFITNTEEEKLVNSLGFKRQAAEKTAQGICEWLGVKYRAPAAPTPVKPPVAPKPIVPTPVAECYRFSALVQKADLDSYINLAKSKSDVSVVQKDPPAWSTWEGTRVV